jgi:hypothetical protein
MRLHISLLMVLLVVGAVSPGTAARPAFIIGQGHSHGGQCTRSSRGSVPALQFIRAPDPFDKPSSLVRTQALENDDEDDGWGNDDDNGSSSSSSSSSPAATAQKGKLPNTSNSEERSRVESMEKRSAPKEQERDLFIPIFSLVSLAGLFGSYGYEMLRLYSRGELYLPWDHK